MSSEIFEEVMSTSPSLPPPEFPINAEIVVETRKAARKRRRREIKAKREIDYASPSSDDSPPRRVRRMLPTPRPRPIHRATPEPESELGRVYRIRTIMNRRLFDRRCQDFVDGVVPRYTDDQFKRIFRIKRQTMSKLQQSFVIGATIDLVPMKKRANIRLSDYMLMFLWFVGNGKSFQELSQVFDVDEDDAVYVVDIVMIFFHVYARVLYRFPQNMYEASGYAGSFRQMFSFPDAIGCLTTHYIRIKDSYQWALVQTVTDTRGMFLNVHTKYWRRFHPRDMLKHSALGEALEDVCHRKFHLIADEEYYLRRCLLTPFEDVESINEIVFNTRHKAIMDSGYKAWDDLLDRFRVLRNVLLDHENVVPIVNACCMIQNICIDDGDYFDVNDYLATSPTPQPDDAVEAVDVIEDDPNLRSLGLLKRRKISHAMVE